MSFNLTDLSVYTQENTDLIAEAVLATKELQNVAIRTGVSAGQSSINVFSGTITEQDRNCAMSDSGELAFDQIVVDVADKAIAQSLCPTQLRDYWMSERMKPGAAGGEEVPFAETISNYVAQSVQANISDFIGEQIKASITVANGAQLQGGTPAQLTTSNAIDQLNDLYDALDERVKLMDNVVAFLSPAQYRTAVRALVAGDFRNYAFGDGEGDIVLPGTTMKLVSAQGLIGSNYIAAFPSSYAIAVFGLESDDENIRMIYDSVSDQVKLRAYYRRGLGVYSIDQCATNGLA